MLFSRAKTQLVSPENALPGREFYAYDVPKTHWVNGNPIQPPFPEHLQTTVFGLGCFWGGERLFWQTPGVWSTAVGYAGGITPYPTYEEVCSGLTGHAETVLVVFDPSRISYPELLQVFFEAHDPTQGMRQGNDIGTQYRSTVYATDDAQLEAAEKAKHAYSGKLHEKLLGAATTEITGPREFYYAEGYHQQYLAKNPDGYCGLSGTGVRCPVELFGPTD